MSEFEEIIGKTVTEININDDKDRIEFICSNDDKFIMYHSQDCCEHVSIDDVVGDINDLIGSPIISAEEITNSGRDDISDWPKDIPVPEYRPESYTWTFYKLATNKGYVTIRWYGSSNGYYSESVYFVRAA